MAKTFRELAVWQRAIDLVTVLYKATQQFPREETYGLTSQLRRAGVSVASNIAEGCGRATTGEYRSFVGFARGSVHEVQTQLTIARRLGFGDPKQLGHAEALAEEISRILWALRQSLTHRLHDAGH
jgi:four helix bundle protein